MPVNPHTVHDAGAWLFGCDYTLSLDEIARHLGFGSEPRTELTATGWDSESRALTDLGEALEAHGGYMGSANWNAFLDCLDDAFSNGHLLLIRSWYPTAARTIAGLVSVIDWALDNRLQDRGGRVALVLEGLPAAQPAVTHLTPTAWRIDEYRATYLTELDRPVG